jgi:folate-dependent phosphoribosylglycinamide formyltransferase PurN
MAVPNWAAKFFIDALLKKRDVLAALPRRSRGLVRTVTDVRQRLPEVHQSAPAADVRVVVLATPSSRKLAHMLGGWDWGFRPAAVVFLSRPHRKASERLWDRVRSDGPRVLLRGIPARAESEPRGTSRPAVDVRRLCGEAGIQTLDVDSLESPEALEAIAKLRPDLFVFAGGAILRAPLLSIPRLGTLNAHMGLLPFYRGMNVAEWAAFHGDPVGCSVHLIDRGIDTGDILCVRPVALDGIRTVTALRDRVDESQMALLSETVRFVVRTGTLPPGRSQAPGEGRQFFRMHGDLLQALERELSSTAPASEPGEALSALSVSR